MAITVLCTNSNSKQVGLVLVKFTISDVYSRYFAWSKTENQNYKLKLQWTFCKYVFTVCKNCTAFSHLKSSNIWETIPTKHGIKIIFFGANTWFKYCELNHSYNNRQFAVQIGMVLHSSSCFVSEVRLVHSNISFYSGLRWELFAPRIFMVFLLCCGT